MKHFSLLKEGSDESPTAQDALRQCYAVVQGHRIKASHIIGCRSVVDHCAHTVQSHESGAVVNTYMYPT